MNYNYDMNVDIDTLCKILSELESIRRNISESTDCMVFALRHSGNFLSGEQYGKACETTLLCAESARKTVENISHVMEYVSKLKTGLESYSRCEYGKC